MLKMESKLERGKKWSKILAAAEFKELDKDVKWIKSQKSIMEDIEAYSNTKNSKKKEK